MNPGAAVWGPNSTPKQTYEAHPASIVAPVRLFVNIAGHNFLAEADTLPQAEDIITEKVSAAIEEAVAHIDRMEGFLAAR